MAKAVVFFSAFCILAFAATIAHCHAASEVFDVEGDVYCDPCRVLFETRLSHKISGATVKLECFNATTDNVTYTTEGVTDTKGHYKLSVKGDFEDDICQVTLIKSPDAECNVLMSGLEKARITCTENSGMTSLSRYANPLGFMTKNPIKGCQEVLDELGLTLADLEL